MRFGNKGIKACESISIQPLHSLANISGLLLANSKWADVG